MMVIRTAPQGNRNYAEVVRIQDYIRNSYRYQEITIRYNTYNRAGEKNWNYERGHKVYERQRYTIESQR